MGTRRESHSLCSETAPVPAKKSAESQSASLRLKASGARKLRGGLLEEPVAAAAVCSSAFSSLMFWSSVRISSDWRFFRKAVCLWSLSFFAVKLTRGAFISCFCAVTASFSFSNWRISLLTLSISSGKMYKSQETPSQTQVSHLSQSSDTLHFLPLVRQWSHVCMASFSHLAIKSVNWEWQKVNSFFFLIPDKGMKKVEFLRTKTLREELVLRLSLDSTCKVHVADIQGVLLMMLTLYKGMSTLSSHMVAGVLMVLTSYKGMSTLSSHVITEVLIVLTLHREMSTLSSTVTHKSLRVLYYHR